MWQANIGEDGRRYYEQNGVEIRLFSDRHEIWHVGRCIAIVFDGLSMAKTLGDIYISAIRNQALAKIAKEML